MELNEHFLNWYSPKDDFYTSVYEIGMVEENTVKGKNLKELSNTELREIRNNVVKFYFDKELTPMSSMQSVTAVIDNIMWTSSPESV